MVYLRSSFDVFRKALFILSSWIEWLFKKNSHANGDHQDYKDRKCYYKYLCLWGSSRQ